MIERCANANGLKKKQRTEKEEEEEEQKTKTACVIVMMMSTPDIALLINFMICTDRYATQTG